MVGEEGVGGGDGFGVGVDGEGELDEGFGAFGGGHGCDLFCCVDCCLLV